MNEGKIDGKTISAYIAVIFTITMKLPQLYHTIKTKRTDDLSMMYLIISVLGHISWMTYGIFDDVNLPLVVTDSVCMVLIFCLISLKLYYDKKNKIEVN